jgi:hypothetical protein
MAKKGQKIKEAMRVATQQREERRKIKKRKRVFAKFAREAEEQGMALSEPMTLTPEESANVEITGGDEEVVEPDEEVFAESDDEEEAPQPSP